MANSRRRLTGVVISNKMDKTAVVQVTRTGRHPLYGKVVKSSKKYMAHDEGNRTSIGDTVVIVESRPISRHKRWVVQEIVSEDLSARTADVSELTGTGEGQDVAADTLAATATAQVEAAAEEPAEADEE